MRAAEARALAEQCIRYAQKKNYKEAARIRQRAYAKDPPGTIGINWNDWGAIWEKDKEYLSYLEREKFSDLKNSIKYIDSLKAAIFIDYLFGFRDAWGLKRHRDFCEEDLKCPMLDEFLHKMNLELETKDFVYYSTAMHNISTKMYNDRIKGKGLNDGKYLHMSYVYQNGEYFLGIPKGTPKDQVDRLLNNRRTFLKEQNQYERMSESGIDKFPKTFKTFQKHKKENSSKYQEWMRQYNSIALENRRKE